MTAETSPTTAPVTAEGLRERIAERTHATSMCEQGDPPACEGACSDLAEEIVAALAGDPGDLLDRTAEAIAEKFTPQSATFDADAGEYRDATLTERADKGGLAVFFTAGDGGRSFRSPTAREVAAAAMSVRWEDHATTAARLAEAERRAEHAEGQMSALREHGTRWETAEAAVRHLERRVAGQDATIGRQANEIERLTVGHRERAETAEAEVDRLQKERAAWRSMAGVEEVEAERDEARTQVAALQQELSRVLAAEIERDNLRARLTGVTIHANRLNTYIAPGSDAWRVLGDLFFALKAPAQAPTEETNDG